MFLVKVPSLPNFNQRMKSWIKQNKIMFYFNNHGTRSGNCVVRLWKLLILLKSVDLGNVAFLL